MDPHLAQLARRGFLQFGAAGYLGLNLGGLWRAQALAAPTTDGPPPIKSCIVLFYYGGPSHLDTYDLKPHAPDSVRSTFQPIATTVPGVQISEHLPQMARVMDRVAIVRSVHHQSTLHDAASIHALTGRPLEGPDRELFQPLPQFYPSFGSAVSYMRRLKGPEVPFVSLPYVFQNVVPTPCQGGGFLGSAYDPLLIDVDPEKRIYPVESLEPRVDLSPDRLLQRRQLLGAIEQQPLVGASDALRQYYERAYQLLDSNIIRAAADLSRESPETRRRYGFGDAPAARGEVNGGGGEMGFARQMRGQNLLLARRLVEAGVPFINVYDCKQQGQNWDAHANGERQHSQHLLPLADQSLATLIDELDERGLLESTLILATGEFGRTPKINGSAGRDHWPNCYSVLLAGGGVRGGAVYGSSDRIGSAPATDPVTPGDLAATIYWRFGLDHTAEIHDQSGRPHRLAAGEPLRALFS